MLYLITQPTQTQGITGCCSMKSWADCVEADQLRTNGSQTDRLHRLKNNRTSHHPSARQTSCWADISMWSESSYLDKEQGINSQRMYWNQDVIGSRSDAEISWGVEARLHREASSNQTRSLWIHATGDSVFSAWTRHDWSCCSVSADQRPFPPV